MLSPLPSVSDAIHACTVNNNEALTLPTLGYRFVSHYVPVNYVIVGAAEKRAAGDLIRATLKSLG